MKCTNGSFLILAYTDFLEGKNNPMHIECF